MKRSMDAVHELLQKNRVDAFLVSKRENVRYLSGFTGSAGVILIASSHDYFITDSRYAVQSEQEIAGFHIQVLKKNEKVPERILRLLKKTRIGRLGFEPEDLRFQSFQELRKKISPIRLIPVTAGLESIRMIKSEAEVRKILKAVRRAEEAFKTVRKKIRAGISEREIALSMEGLIRRAGAARAAFDLIVSSGERSAMPHGTASEKRLMQGDLVVVDFGAECGGYFSDMTRTLFIGKRFAGKKRKIFETVLDAQNEAIRAIKPGKYLAEIDATARKMIQKAGFGKYFGHGTGHGIGLEVHELPHVAPKNRMRIREGMVFTVEPGIYIPGLGGVRIEDMVQVTVDGCRVLTTLSKGWKAVEGEV
ncbi:MAG: hypothetical protein CO150_05910 [Nitrospirae bacterium CG_4_9_14_3_um_filter_53_35]|nr:MAG: hypothetical protein AUK29_04425 [Nitrospirae bacterium CG2_30_53_67]PIS38079.1 MAG: hypothetical protein COT35_02710 [Nitrospirae bacterium CG08_land_8_20_14_0_20_52_24]PIV85697.1 MAG: hypothetical protein COW52_00930 [Nitrospirae bacterium CG17_big_fil_post_rev_8_21_14_2_50_50_9]PIW84457.1 MAG: hypothetical protein COZ95_09615 [Nitrospirae bacterium CG_4_8_14_3_um_filter_50_41]PIX87005.1 MAG: hypothetical protein COZ32_00490 [Nitrospirae bacterium CG_4_10_14_3_um_filter_53_41]PJA7481